LTLELKNSTITIRLLSIALGLAIIGVVFIAYGVNPFSAYGVIFHGAFGSIYGLSETVAKSIPLILCSLGLALAFQATFWNIGAEGQLVMGAICGSGIALTFPELPAYVLVPLMFLVSFVGGAAWGLVPTLLKTRLKINEVITTLMMNYIAIRILQYLLFGPWKGKTAWGFPYTDIFSSSAQLPTIGDTRIHYPTLIIAIAAVAAVYFLIDRTILGLEIRAVGDNPAAARSEGINYTKIILVVMMISGGLAGIAGIGEAAGIFSRLRLGISQGYGFTSIIIAWLCSLQPLYTIIVSLLYSGLLVGGEMIQISLGLPKGIIDVFNGVLLFSILAGEFLIRNRGRTES
jgi:ABC-type uncharacterized transport system permease subunit